jgi:hypothetical protein
MLSWYLARARAASKARIANLRRDNAHLHRRCDAGVKIVVIVFVDSEIVAHGAHGAHPNDINLGRKQQLS